MKSRSTPKRSEKSSSSTSGCCAGHGPVPPMWPSRPRSAPPPGTGSGLTHTAVRRRRQTALRIRRPWRTSPRSALRFRGAGAGRRTRWRSDRASRPDSSGRAGHCAGRTPSSEAAVECGPPPHRGRNGAQSRLSRTPAVGCNRRSRRTTRNRAHSCSGLRTSDSGREIIAFSGSHYLRL